VDRIVISSASPDEESYKGGLEPDGIRVGEFFIEEWTKQAGRGGSLKAAFEYATEKTEIFTRKGSLATPHVIFNDVAAQHPLLEDNRSFDLLDLAGNNALDSAAGADGELADRLFLGVGPTYATNAVANPADISTVTSTVHLAAGVSTSLLKLTTNDDSKVASAWIEVRAPAVTYTPVGADVTQQIDPNLDRSILFPPVTGVLDNWYTTYGNFLAAGKYEVFYFVEDATTAEISPIRRSVVYRNYTGNTAPAAFNLNAPVDGDTTATVLLFDWDNSNDPDGVTYTLEIAAEQDPAGDIDNPPTDPWECSFTTENIVYRKEELSSSHAYVGPEAGLVDATDYCWRVLAVDGYGAITAGTPGYWVFTTDDANGYLGFVSGTVRDAATLVGLAGAVVTPLKPGGTNPLVVDYYEDKGSYLIAVDPVGTYTLSASLPGYGAGSKPGVAVTTVENSGEDILLATTSLDSDGDGLPDNVETNTRVYVGPANTGTDPGNPDTDGDGLNDGAEVNTYNTNPTLRDSDGDGFSDGVEIGAGTNPNNQNGPWPAPDGDLAPLGVYDGIVNVADYLIAQRMALGLVPQDAVAIAHGDLQQTGASAGIIDTADVLLILQQALNGP
jgi:hypothetical protein